MWESNDSALPVDSLAEDYDASVAAAAAGIGVVAAQQSEMDSAPAYSLPSVACAHVDRTLG